MVRRLIVEHGGEDVERHVWRLDGDLFVGGSYKLDGPSPGSGGDGLPSDSARALSTRGAHFLWEDMLGGQQMPRDWHAESGVVSGVIDIPYELSVENIYKRRVERNRNIGRPLNEACQLRKWRRIRNVEARMRDQGYPVVRLVYGDGLYEQVHDVLRSGGWACDVHPVWWEYDWATHMRSRAA